MAGRTITPKQLAQQWLRLPNKFEVNVFNFETLAGQAVKGIFKESFSLRRFNSAGSSPWKGHSKAWMSRKDYKPHPILEETGNLKNSIVWARDNRGKQRSVIIYSSAAALKHSKRQYGRNFYYAQVHNDPDGTYTNRMGRHNQTHRSTQRQFIGYSSVARDKLESLGKHIFDGFPK